jgi:hypothetical protein
LELSLHGIPRPTGTQRICNWVKAVLGTDKSRGYCMEMICADFLADAHLQYANPENLLISLRSL